jgi:hypothetical protein
MNSGPRLAALSLIALASPAACQQRPSTPAPPAGEVLLAAEADRRCDLPHLQGVIIHEEFVSTTRDTAAVAAVLADMMRASPLGYCSTGSRQHVSTLARQVDTPTGPEWLQVHFQVSHGEGVGTRIRVWSRWGVPGALDPRRPSSWEDHPVFLHHVQPLIGLVREAVR